MLIAEGGSRATWNYEMNGMMQLGGDSVRFELGAVAGSPKVPQW